MLSLNRCNYTFLVGICSLGLFLGMERDSHAESALRALGEAYHKEYKELEKLGPKPTPEQVEEVQTRAFSHAYKLVNKEIAERREKYFNAHLGAEFKVRDRLARAAEAKIGPEGAETDAGSLAGKDAPSRTPAAAGGKDPRKGATTGEVGAASGAGTLELQNQKKEKAAPAVEDGIIMER